MKKQYVLLIVIFLAAVLRLSHLDQFPPSLYSDEVSQGYNAYSLLKTGKDEFGSSWPVSIRSFGDWKPPLQTYLMIPTIALFGLNEWGVRLPGAILGTLSIWLFFLLVKELDSYFFKQKHEIVPYIAAFLLTISPWHILLTRSAMLVGVTSFFILLGLWGFMKGLTRPKYWYVSSTSFAISIYGYYGSRVFVPFLCILLFITFWDKIRLKIASLLGPAGIFLLLLLPLGNAYVKSPDVVFGRVKTVSVFHDEGVRQSTYELERIDATQNMNSSATFFHSISHAYSMDIMRRFFQHLDGNFLFLTGDLHPPFQIPGMGILYIVDGFLLVLGSAYILKKNSHSAKYILGFLAISIIPAALTFVTPSANRTFFGLIPIIILVSFGIYSLIKHKLFMGFVFVFYVVQGLFFLYSFTVVLPKNHASWWHHGFRELYGYLEITQNEEKTIYISENVSVPYIFLLFYQKIDPITVASNIRRDRHLDEYGFEHVSSFGRYEFIKDFDWNIEKDNLASNSLLVVGGNEKIEELKEKNRIVYSDGETAFIIYEL